MSGYYISNTIHLTSNLLNLERRIHVLVIKSTTQHLLGKCCYYYSVYGNYYLI